MPFLSSPSPIKVPLLPYCYFSSPETPNHFRPLNRFHTHESAVISTATTPPPSKRCCLANSHWLLKSSTISSSVAHILRPTLILQPLPTLSPSLFFISTLIPHPP